MATHDVLPLHVSIVMEKNMGFLIRCQYCDEKNTLQFVVGLVVGVVVMLVVIYIQVLWWNSTLQLVVGLVVILVVIYININDYKHNYNPNYK